MKDTRDADPTEPRLDSATANRARELSAHLRVLGRAELVRELPPTDLVVGRRTEGTATESGLLTFSDPAMSRRHAQFVGPPGAWRLRDLGSRNSTFVDGHALPPGGEVTITDGMVVRLGDTLLLLRHGPAPRVGVVEVAPGVFPGRAPSAYAVRRRLQALLASAGHVLIQGETGTGKERIARAFAVPGRPFVPQNCAELSRDLARSELFGHARGSFSSALTAKQGLVDTADHGVLFLDEVGELTPDVQAELLRFLEDGYYRPVGATELRRSSARLVAATNVDLDVAVRSGRFRRDLLARLRASNPPLELPPLRERREDLLAWAGEFFDQARKEHERGAETAHRSLARSDRAEPGARDRAEFPRTDANRPLGDSVDLTAIWPWHAGLAECMLLYPWPANLRELRGVSRGLAQTGVPCAELRADDLPEALREFRRGLRGATEPLAVVAPVAPAQPERAQLEAALTIHAGSVRATAAQFGVDRRKLYRWCERLGIDLDLFRANPEPEDRDE